MPAGAFNEAASTLGGRAWVGGDPRNPWGESTLCCQGVWPLLTYKAQSLGVNSSHTVTDFFVDQEAPTNKTAMCFLLHYPSNSVFKNE